MKYSNTEEGLDVLVLSPITRSVVLKGVVLQGELAKVDDAGKSANGNANGSTEEE